MVLMDRFAWVVMLFIDSEYYLRILVNGQMVYQMLFLMEVPCVTTISIIPTLRVPGATNIGA